MDSNQKEAEVLAQDEKVRALGFKVARELSLSEVEEIGGGLKAIETNPGYLPDVTDWAG